MADTDATERTLSDLITRLANVPTAAPRTTNRRLLRDMLVSVHLYPTLGSETGVVSERYPYGDVRRFGADPTGVALSDTAFANAMSSSTIVDAPTGTYLLSSALNLGANTTLRGTSSYDTLLQFTGATDGVVISASFKRIQLTGVNIQTSNASGGKALSVTTASNGYIADIKITKTGSGRWSNAIWGNNWQTTNIYGIRINNCATVGIHLEYGCNALQFYGYEVIGSSGVGTIERAIELDATNSLAAGEVLFDVYFTGGTLQGYFTKSLIYSDGVKPLVTQTHLENTNASPSDGADVWLVGSTTAIVNAKFNDLQGGSFGSVGSLRNLSITNSEVGAITIGAANLIASIVNTRYSSLTDTGGQTTVIGCSDGSGNNVANIINGTGLTLKMSGTTRYVADANGLKIAATAAAGSAGELKIGSTTATTVGAAGAASALPANPLGYLVFFVGATQVKVPYYNA